MQIKNVLLIATMVAVVAWGAIFFKSALGSSEQSYRAQQRVPAYGHPGYELGNHIVTPDDEHAATQVISEQLALFKRHDYAKALTLESSFTPRNPVSAGSFRAMIETSYPQLAHSERVHFGSAQWNACGDMLVMPVTVATTKGEPVTAVYVLHKEGSHYRVVSIRGGDHECPAEAEQQALRS